MSSCVVKKLRCKENLQNLEFDDRKSFERATRAVDLNKSNTDVFITLLLLHFSLYEHYSFYGYGVLVAIFRLCPKLL